MNTLNALILPDDLIWQDELDWSGVAQQITPTLTGALIVEENAAPDGRPITLVGVTTRGLVLRLKTLEGQVTPQMSMTLQDGLTRTVSWRRPGVQAEPLHDFSNPDDDDPYRLTLQFLEID